MFKKSMFSFSTILKTVLPVEGLFNGVTTPIIGAAGRTQSEIVITPFGDAEDLRFGLTTMGKLSQLSIPG
jgi:hypothetical protein